MFSRADREESLVVTCSLKEYAIYYQAAPKDRGDLFARWRFLRRTTLSAFLEETSVPAHTGPHIQPHQAHSWKAAGVVPQKKTKRLPAMVQLGSKDSSLFRQVVRHYENKQYKKGALRKTSQSLQSKLTTRFMLNRYQDRGPGSSQEPQSWRYASDESSHHELLRTVGGGFCSSEDRTEK
jgi:hypothetical protein